MVPWNYDMSQEKYDGLFISNGPGDPSLASETVANIRKVFELLKMPIITKSKVIPNRNVSMIGDRSWRVTDQNQCLASAWGTS